jgi:hypothetical protein
MYVYDLSLDQVPCPQLQCFVSYLHKTESFHVLFFTLQKFSLIKIHIREGPITVQHFSILK